MSGPEKSLHLRQEEVVAGLGLEAMIASKFGLEASGIGGGAPRADTQSEMTTGGRAVGTGGGEGGLLLKPMSNADFRGGGAITLFVSVAVALLLEGRLGKQGLAGRSGVFSWGGKAWLGTSLRGLLIAFSVALLFLTCSGAVLEGRGGNADGSKAGARTRQTDPLL